MREGSLGGLLSNRVEHGGSRAGSGATHGSELGVGCGRYREELQEEGDDVFAHNPLSQLSLLHFGPAVC